MKDFDIPFKQQMEAVAKQSNVLKAIKIDSLLYEILEAVRKECLTASTKYPPFHSMHEGYAVILEELDELKEAIWKSKGVRLNPVAAKEAIQVAAMAVRFILDLEGEK